MTTGTKVYIYENANYGVVVGDSEMPEAIVTKLYKVYNKIYNVVELETSILPRAMQEADELSDMLVAMESGTPPTMIDNPLIN